MYGNDFGPAVVTDEESQVPPEQAEFDRLVVCSGHHWNPNLPAYPGEFSGRILHAHDYRKAEPFRDQAAGIVQDGLQVVGMQRQLPEAGERGLLGQ